jgi:hypothetical protein
MRESKVAQIIKRRATIRPRRGIKGYFFFALFVILNGLMAYIFFIDLWQWVARVHATRVADGDAENRARALVVNVATWLVIAAISGFFVWLTRGRREHVEVEEIRPDGNAGS